MNKPEHLTDAADNGGRCPVNFAMDKFGDRWSLLVVRDLMFLGKRRYNEFLTSWEGISTNILADRLKQLQAQGLVEKFPDPDNGRTAIYLLTDYGLSLYPLMLEVMRWGLQHDGRAEVMPEVADALEHDSEVLGKKIRSTMRAERKRLSRH